MKVAVIGSGRIGSRLARLLVDAGHTVLIANSRDRKSLAALVTSLGPAASAHTVADAAGLAEVVVLAVPFAATRDLFPPEIVTGKILVDASNKFRSAESGATSSEQLAAWYPGASVVKSFNTMHFEALEAAGAEPHLVHFVAGDDDAAKKTVAGLIESIGFDVIDTGDLRTGSRLQQPGGPLFNILLTADQARIRLAAAHGRN
jgi:predicted dinucleotide-binding enzyme